MRRSLLLTLALIGGCSKGPQADLQYIAQVRSLAAEWALVNRQAAQGKLTGAYVSAMHQSIREQVEAATKALTQPNSAYAREIEAIAAEPDNAPPDRLRGHSDRLKKLEQDLESA